MCKFEAQPVVGDEAFGGEGTADVHMDALKFCLDLSIRDPFYHEVHLEEYSIGLVDSTGNEMKNFKRENLYLCPKPATGAELDQDWELSSQEVSDALSADGSLRIRCRIKTKEQEFDNDESSLGMIADLTKDFNSNDFSDAVLVSLGIIVNLIQDPNTIRSIYRQSPIFPSVNKKLF